MTNRVDINNVLADIRNLRAQMRQSARVEQELSAEQLKPTRKPEEVPEFSQMLKQAVDNVNDLQKTSSDLRTAYEQGDPQADLTKVMIASQKSSVAFQALTQVRNKVVQAYEDIMKMPI
ncbi:MULTISPECIES: flagellar hook-basal body complex protein FliE [unclassified Hahella]|uniref:flagellar hook-basal body complex protein FliE n=1 Tax=unclassified Hahella TaxID=2624107 RepID=UPI000FDEF9C4|nr:MULTISPECIES: flagellar hook-basal body complex protein FliE [unclassified Hahella]AZZ90966.1 flagellar hook-basal body complex protein FliE [Hahella sp. KA22]MBU6949883.1 flagellar hook-basal body complex protein FliE [Hahella sp. HN01]MDG9668323.1 flagellar hook-basal body complex protein FliE [Hahella sp. CR1]QAY54336.1 flagellar hook-basal body complex protein FliE [Hahella sp. KA22]